MLLQSWSMLNCYVSAQLMMMLLSYTEQCGNRPQWCRTWYLTCRPSRPKPAAELSYRNDDLGLFAANNSWTDEHRFLWCICHLWRPEQVVVVQVATNTIHDSWKKNQQSSSPSPCWVMNEKWVWELFFNNPPLKGEAGWCHSFTSIAAL